MTPAVSARNVLLLRPLALALVLLPLVTGPLLASSDWWFGAPYPRPPGPGSVPLGSATEVPLSLWTSATYPDGLALGWANGISFGDYDGDGYIDLFAYQSGNLWRNVGGLDWELAADLDSLLPFAEQRYGSSFGDYNNDGLPDIGTEPRSFNGDETFHLLWNLGSGPNFVDVATDPAIVDVQPFGNSETLCWADVNCDGNLDLFVPVYRHFGGPGNFFLFNLGPTGPGGAYRFTEVSAAAGLDNTLELARPEGAQFVDADFDGDLDLYSNGVLYRNVSTPDTPAFEAMTESGSGIGLSDELDEGAMFFDYDLDGDYDLIIAYAFEGVRIWESHGDGNFFAAPQNVVDSPLTGLVLGMSAADWDLDGDIDFTTREVFRRNRLIEDGDKHFTVATHSIPTEHQHNPTPAWGDWDKDGDLDCALANWGQNDAHLYENTLYGTDTPSSEKRHLRIRPVGNSPTVPQGLENQYGASVELHLLNVADGYRRRQFVASSHGYLNQNEYTLHFGLPADPVPGDPAQDLRLDVTVDYPSLPSDGLWRVDKHVNPVLGQIDLAHLDDREIKVYRCGQVLLDGVLYEAPPLAAPLLTTTTGGLASPTTTLPLPAPQNANPDSYVGLSIHTLNATDKTRVTEVILDGVLDSPTQCGPDAFNLAFWDVTNTQVPFLVAGSRINATTASGNRRSYFRTDVILEPGREYRVVARVRSYRATTIAAAVDDGPIEVLGGLSYQDEAPCNGVAVTTAAESPTQAFLALRFNAAGIGSEQADPLADSLKLDKGPSGVTLEWLGLTGVAGYEVLRCDAAGGPCVPVGYAAADQNTYTDPDATGDLLWYKVRALRDCTAASPRVPETI
jgi:hypothetical protein